MGLSFEFPVYTRSGLVIEEGCGYRVRDDQGREFIDFYGGHAVACLGYRHPALVHALCGQAEKLMFQTNAVDLTVRADACKALIDIAPGGLDRVLLVNSGAEANENALRLAFMQTKRRKVVALSGAFHGRTAASGAITYGAANSWYAFPSQPFDVEFVDVNDVTALNLALDHVTAAFIFEPVQGVAGAVDLDPEFVAEARRFCTDRGIKMIADEVQSGIGRTGEWFGVQGLGVVPDFMTTAKGLAGGFPVGALLAPAEVANTLSVGSFGTTFGGGPMACAMIAATLYAMRDEDVLANVNRISERIKNEALVGPVTGISGKGLLLGLHCNKPAKEVLVQLRQKGILAGDAKNPYVVRLLPPLIIDDLAVDVLIGALREIGK